MVTLHNDDCLKVLQAMADNSVDSIVTDPPYGMSQHKQADIKTALAAWLNGDEYVHGSKGFLGNEWDRFVPSPIMWSEALRVLKPGGHILCAASTRTSDLMGMSLRLAGFEIRDSVLWVYGSGFPKSHNIGKAYDKLQGNSRTVVDGGQVAGTLGSNTMDGGKANPDYQHTTGNSEWEGKGTALKPAHEPFILARKPIEANLTITENCIKWGTGAIEIDGCRVPTDDLNGGAYRNADVGTNDFFTGLKRGVIGEYAQPEGRFPANVIIDDSEIVASQFPQTTSGARKEYNHAPTAATVNFKSGCLKSNACKGSSGSAARFFYCAKASKTERGVGNNHPTVKPISLMRYLCRLITPTNGVILDPFMGSGTTGIAAKLEGFSFIGCELNNDYFKIASTRINLGA